MLVIYKSSSYGKNFYIVNTEVIR